MWTSAPRPRAGSTTTPCRRAARRHLEVCSTTRIRELTILVKRTWCPSTRGTTRATTTRRPSRWPPFLLMRGRRGLPHRRRLDERGGRGAAASRATRPLVVRTRRRRLHRRRRRRRLLSLLKRRATRRAAASSSPRAAASAARAAGSCTRTRPPRRRRRTSPSKSSLGSQGRALVIKREIVLNRREGK